MSQGCKYFPAQGGYCRNVPGDVIDEQCTLYQNRCLTNEEYTKRTGQAPPLRQPIATPSVPSVPSAPLPTPVESTKEEEIVREGLEYIQGPVSWYYFESGPELFGIRRRYHFFGDAHFSSTGGCTERYSVPCAQVDLTGKISNINKRCYDITYLLMDLFANSQKEKRYTDFLLELPFKTQRGATHSKLDQLVETLKSTQLDDDQTSRLDITALTEIDNDKTLKKVDMIPSVRNLDYISSLYVVFHDCFQMSKEKCPYRPYVRFHYVDVRLSENNRAIALNTYIFAEKLSDILSSMAMYYQLLTFTTFGGVPEIAKLKQSIIESVEFTNRIISKIYVRGHTLEGTNINYNLELFNIALESDNYIEDVNRLLDTLLEGSKVGTEDYKKFEKFRQDMTLPVVQRDGKIQHRTRVQLQELAQENIRVGGKNLASLIVEFITRLYGELNFVEVYSNWRNFYTVVYPAFLNARSEDSIRKGVYELERYMLSRRSGIQLVEADALLHDGYMLARMFRTFPTPRYGRSQHVPSDRVITYTGAKHTENYVRFFSEMLGLRPIDSRVNHYNLDKLDFTNINRCLRDSKFGEYF